MDASAMHGVGLVSLPALGALQLRRRAVDEVLLSDALGHRAVLVDYVKVAWLASSLATVTGALGAGLESDAAMREAAYGYRPERHTERERDRLDADRA
jgi:hypothetical protein